MVFPTCSRCLLEFDKGRGDEVARGTREGKEREKRERKMRAGEYLGLICSWYIFQSCFDELFHVFGKVCFYLVLLQLLGEKGERKTD